MAKAKANESVQDVGGKPALAAQAEVWPASSRRSAADEALYCGVEERPKAFAEKGSELYEKTQFS